MKAARKKNPPVAGSSGWQMLLVEKWSRQLNLAEIALAISISPAGRIARAVVAAAVIGGCHA